MDCADLGKLTDLDGLLREAEAPGIGQERAKLPVET